MALKIAECKAKNILFHFLQNIRLLMREVKTSVGDYARKRAKKFQYFTKNKFCLSNRFPDFADDEVLNRLS